MTSPRGIATIDRTDFATKCRAPIIGWAEFHRGELLNYKAFRWKGRTYEESVGLRNDLEKGIALSRVKHGGGIDLQILDRIYEWGFGKPFPLQDEEETLKATEEAFRYLGQEDCYRACRRLMQIPDVGVTGATKILGLSNQDRLCIYDSRVGRALNDLKRDQQKIIRRPPGRNRPGDNVANKGEWARDYQKLIWTLEIMRDYLEDEGNPRIADLEMALFMKGSAATR